MGQIAANRRAKGRWKLQKAAEQRIQAKFSGCNKKKMHSAFLKVDERVCGEA
jgi:hypothetical protein